MKKFMKSLPSYFSVIPATVRYDRRLKANEKIIFSEITALSNKYGFCTANNSYFEYIYQKGASTIATWLHDLRKFGYIKVFVIKNGGHHKSRRIFPISDSAKALKKTKAMITRMTPPENKTGLKNWTGTLPKNWRGTPLENESRPKSRSTDTTVTTSRISSPNKTSNNKTSNNNSVKGVRKSGDFHSVKHSGGSPTGTINDHFIDLWGKDLSLTGLRRVGKWLKVDTPELIEKAMDYTNTRIGGELATRPGFSREKSALGYTYAMLRNWGYEHIHTLKELNAKVKARTVATRQKRRKKYTAKKDEKNHVYHNTGEVNRCAQCIGYHRTGDLFSVTPENVKIAKFMIENHMSAHDDNEIEKAIDLMRR